MTHALYITLLTGKELNIMAYDRKGIENKDESYHISVVTAFWDKT